MDDLNEKIKHVFSDLRIRCAYNMPSFWANSGKDYKVIPTKYANGYQDALEDAEREITEVLSAQPEPLTDKEQRIFLAAMRRERKVCTYAHEPCEVPLTKVCDEIVRKVKGALWT